MPARVRNTGFWSRRFRAANLIGARRQSKLSEVGVGAKKFDIDSVESKGEAQSRYASRKDVRWSAYYTSTHVSQNNKTSSLLRQPEQHRPDVVAATNVITELKKSKTPVNKIDENFKISRFIGDSEYRYLFTLLTVISFLLFVFESETGGFLFFLIVFAMFVTRFVKVVGKDVD